MIILPNGGRLITTEAELLAIDPTGAEILFADFETTSLNDKLDSLNPWHHCCALGLAFAFDSFPDVWYVPLRHRYDFANVSLPVFAGWWERVLSSVRRWVNHHVKYDAHVSANDPEIGVAVPESLELFCTVVHSKIIDSDRQYRGGYGLDALSLAWLGMDISEYEAAIKRWLGKGQHDYGRVPVEDMAPYACQDIIANRPLYKYIQQRRPAECDQIAALETELTSILLNMEQTGMRVDRDELMVRELEITATMLELEVELHDLIGRTVNPTSPEDTYDVLCNQYGLPVLGWTDEDDEGQPAGNPSFNKYAMKKYLVHPLAPHRVVEIIATYRKLSTHRSLFLRKYQELQGRDGRLHSSYNQCVRSGRMGCKDPNAQQLDELAKTLIHPDEGESILSADQSQIEFRVIVHYINDSDCIKAYNENPDTDFHQWVADMVPTKRRPAKTMNFMMGYGGGKKKTVRVLSADNEVVGGIVDKIDQMVAEGRIAEAQRSALFDAMAKELAEGVYDRYHRTLPTLKPTSRRAGAACYERGHVRTLLGRHRHLPKDKSHVAFNSVCQGSAADIQKDRTVALYRALRAAGLERVVKMIANVHDATVLQGPTRILRDPEFQARVAWILEHPIACALRVPLRVTLGVSERDWKEADKSAKPIKYSAEQVSRFQSADQQDMLMDWRIGQEQPTDRAERVDCRYQPDQ